MRDTKKRRVATVLGNDFRRNKYVYAMVLPIVAYYFIFHYGPMYGVQIAFRDFSPIRGIWGSEFVGWEHFHTFFDSYYFGRIIRNTLLISLYDVLFGFPAPILLALLLNEIARTAFKRTVQTITYMPHFISIVVVAGMIFDFAARDGLINQFLGLFGLEPVAYMMEARWFRTVFVSSGIWQNIGWGSIIYLAAIAGIDQAQYEAARIDGANRFQRMLHVTLPGMMQMIVILLILRIGNLMTVSDEKILLLYNPLTYETADVISTYVYRKGILGMDYSESAAVGLFNSVINFVLLVAANSISRKISDNKLW